jgi:GMP synthase (glutamine-hydrolysing)
MSARILIVKNIGREGPGLLRDVLMQHHVEADMVELDRGETIPALRGYGALVVLGGPSSANDDTPVMHNQISRVQEALAANMPYLGICLGHQVLAKAAGAEVTSALEKEIGLFKTPGVPYTVELTEAGRNDSLFQGLDSALATFQLHGEAVQPAPGIEVLARSTSGEVQAIRVGSNAYGLQMHFEVVPEMLAVWAAQDDDLREFDSAALQKQFGEASATLMGNGRRLFGNFLRISQLTTSIDLTESERARAQ